MYTTDEAFEERAQWCVFLNESKIFKFKKLGKYEVCATFENLIAFFKTFFPKIEIPDKSAGKQLQIDALCKALSFNLTLTANIREVIKPNFGGQHYENLQIDFSVNGEHIFIWEIYQYFNKLADGSIERRTGHSDYRFKDGRQTFDD